VYQKLSQSQLVLKAVEENFEIVKYTRGIPRKIRSRPRGITAKIIPVTVVTAGFVLISVSTPAGFLRKPAGLYPLPHPCKSLAWIPQDL